MYSDLSGMMSNDAATEGCTWGKIADGCRRSDGNGGAMMLQNAVIVAAIKIGLVPSEGKRRRKEEEEQNVTRNTNGDRMGCGVNTSENMHLEAV